MELLTKHCKACAKPLARFKVNYKCANRSNVLERMFRVTVKDDNADIQLPSFCYSCHNILLCSQKVKEENRLHTHTHTVQVFTCCLHSVLVVT